MKSIMRKLTLVATFLALTATPAMLASDAQAQTKIHQVGFRVLYMAPILLALDKGYFKEEGIDFTFSEISSGALGPAALIAGDAQITDSSPLSVARLQKQGKQLLMFYNLVKRVTLELVVRTDYLKKLGVTAKSPIEERYKVLGGLKFGITRPGAPTDTFARYFLTKGGFDPDKSANLISMGGVPALEAAFRSSRVDAFMLSPPLPQKMEAEGVGTILVRNTAGEVPELADTVYNAIITTPEYAKANGPVLKAYVRAVRKATKWIVDNQEDAIKMLAATYFKDTSLDTLRTSMNALLPAISKTGRIDGKGVDSYLNIFNVIGRGVDEKLVEGKAWTNDYIN